MAAIAPTKNPILMGLESSTPFLAPPTGGDPRTMIGQEPPTTPKVEDKPQTPADKSPITESTRPTQDLPYSKESFGGAKRTRVAANNPITTSAMNGLMGAGTGLQY
jgi:hypothetical protein